MSIQTLHQQEHRKNQPGQSSGKSEYLLYKFTYHNHDVGCDINVKLVATVQYIVSLPVGGDVKVVFDIRLLI